MTTTALATAAKETIRAEKRAAREQARAEKLAAAALHVVARAAFKSHSATLYAIKSQEKVYHVTVANGRVTSCMNPATGESCQGWQYNHKCKHADFALAHEAQYGALVTKSCNMSEHVEETLSVQEEDNPLLVGESPVTQALVIDRGNGNGDIVIRERDGRTTLLFASARELALLAGGYRMVSAEQYRMEEQQRYRDAYPGDYGYCDAA